MEVQGSRLQNAHVAKANRRRSRRERKLALLEDVDKLKKKLRHEENIHRALERAFNRSLGALPRLPPYLPPYTLELLAEVAVSEAEVVRLEEQVVDFRQGLYQEAVYISSRRNAENSADGCNHLSFKNSKHERSKSLSSGEPNLGLSKDHLSLFLTRTASSRKPVSSNSNSDQVGHRNSRLVHGKQALKNANSALEDERGKENPCCSNLTKDKQSPQKKITATNSPVMLSPANKPGLMRDCVVLDPLKPQCRLNQERAQESTSFNSADRISESENTANKISEDVLKCLSSIFLRLSTTKGKTLESEPFASLMTLASNENNHEIGFLGPYGICSDFEKRDIGPFKYVCAIEVGSVDLNRKTSALFLIDRLKILLGKLASVNVEGLTHQQKLAFWTNTYNSCMMNAFLEHGIPENPEMVVALMQKVRVYTALQVESKLEAAKRDYLQAAVGISKAKNLIIPKLLDWYPLDFAEDLEALLDWVCLRLPEEFRKETVKRLETRKQARITVSSSNAI